MYLPSRKIEKGRDIMMNGLKKEQALLEAVQSAETAAIRLRQYAAAELTGRQSATSVSGEAKDITSVEFTTERWLSTNIILFLAVL